MPGKRSEHTDDPLDYVQYKLEHGFEGQTIFEIDSMPGEKSGRIFSTNSGSLSNDENQLRGLRQEEFFADSGLAYSLSSPGEADETQQAWQATSRQIIICL